MVVKGLDALVMRNISCHQGEVMAQGQSSNHGVSATNWLSRAFQVRVDTTG